MSFKVSSSSISFLFWTSSTATRLSRHLTYSFFRRRHSLAASLKENRKQKGKQDIFSHARYWQGGWRRLGKCDHGGVPHPGTRGLIQCQTLKPNWVLKGHWGPFHKSFHKAISSMAAPPALIRVQSKQGPSQRQLLCFMAIKIFEGLEFLNEGLVLVFKHSHAVFKTLDIFFLLPATLPGSFPGTNTRQVTRGTTSQRSPERPPGPNRQAVLGQLWTERHGTTAVTKHVPGRVATLSQQERWHSDNWPGICGTRCFLRVHSPWSQGPERFSAKTIGTHPHMNSYRIQQQQKWQVCSILLTIFVHQKPHVLSRVNFDQKWLEQLVLSNLKPQYGRFSFFKTKFQLRQDQLGWQAIIYWLEKQHG